MKLACAADEVTSVTPDEVRSVLDRDEKGEYLLLDVKGLLHELAWEERKHADVLLRQMAEVVRR